MSFEEFSQFLTGIQHEKSYLPPVRVLFVGDDQTFNDFVKVYVEQVLQIQANLVEDDNELFSDDDVFDLNDSGANNAQVRDNGRTSVRRVTS